ncbi:hypothetical protein MJO28_003056 [Puccinia striiformis f. sp. tritici]|uniref:Uncharacterized protein n=1 Tax=Puccinia striiformis f. sp. tritici TaxID=168172 RepID=A0ACC0ETS4_9BASI|nr:hypothetical protein MJO28_003056 [Puccinia striiformis f. sp. tritici]
MAPFWILCRCTACATFSHTNTQGELIVGREWNKHMVTYKEHLKKPSSKPSTSSPQISVQATTSDGTNNLSRNEAARSVSRPSGSQVPPEMTEPHLLVALDSMLFSDVAPIPDPKITLWEGIIMDCDLPVLPDQLYIPVDIRTIIICCPQCFYLYLIDSPPQKCTARATRRSKKCLEPLYKPAPGTASSPQLRQHFSIRSFTHWLACSLTRPQIEDLLAKSLTPSQSSQNLTISDVWDSDMWKTLKTSEGNSLAFPTAGKHILLGTVALVCLNLPPDY